MKLISIFFFLTFATIANCEIFSSIEELADLYSNQETMIKELDGLIGNLKDDIEKLKSKLRFLKDENYAMKKNLQNYIINPLNAFVLIKSLSYDVESVEATLYKTVERFTENVEQIRLPMSDLQGAVEGFYRLQYTYQLKSADLARGQIQGEKYRRSLKADALFVLGKNMISHNTSYAEEYLQLSLERNEESKKLEPFEILQEMFICYNESRKCDEAIATLDKMQLLEPDNKPFLEMRSAYESNDVCRNEPEKEENGDDDCSGTHMTPLKEKLIFAQACRGERLQSTAEQSKLYCFMQSNTPFTKIAPLKVEIANFSPYVVVFHEILSDAEMEVFINLSRPKLARAKVMTTDTSSIVSSVRVAKINWLYESEHESLKVFTKRVGDMSGLNMETAEAWQVQNYGIGGHYIMHQDFSHKGQSFNQNTGNRIATTLFYLSDVEKGGATVFPLLRLYIPARKGTAAFWYNLSTSGDREYITLHGACPILVGSKWVSNKWIHEYGQERHRPCELVERPTDEEYYSKEYIL